MTLAMHQFYTSLFIISFFMTTQSCWAPPPGQGGIGDVLEPAAAPPSTGPSDTASPDSETQIMKRLIERHRALVVHDEIKARLQPTTGRDLDELEHVLREDNPQGQKKVKLLIEIGKDRMQEGQLGWAIRNFKEAADLIPEVQETTPEDKWDLLLTLGAAQAKETTTKHYHPNPAEAVATFERIPLDADKYHWQAEYQKRRLLQQVRLSQQMQGTSTKPLDSLAELFATIPQEAGLYYGQAQYRLGDIYFNQKEYGNAAEAYLKAVSVPTLAVKMRTAAVVQLARSYALESNFYTAAQNYRDALPLLEGDIGMQIQLEYLAVQRRLGLYVSVEDSLNALLGLEKANATEDENARFLRALIHCDILQKPGECVIPANIPHLRETLTANWMFSPGEMSNRTEMLTSIENALKRQREERMLNTLNGDSPEEGVPAGLSSQDSWYLVNTKAESDPHAPTELVRTLENSTRALTGVCQGGAGVVVRACKSTGDLLDSAVTGLGRHVINPVLSLVDNDG